MRCVAIGTLGLVVAALAFPAQAAERPIDFNNDIRPILSDKCFRCHGPDAGNRKRGLRLDTPEGLAKDVDGHPAVVPGNPARSVVFQRLVTTDDDERMPPPDSGKSLTADQVALMKTWIQQGAPWQRHWSFEPVRRAAPPTVVQTDWVRNDIDRFISARLETENLTLSPPADRTTVIRRLMLDLTGLPPTPAEVRAFETDRRPDAYERLVDQTLASPHYGERWGRHFLDLARYADSNGYGIDAPRAIWKYRDWVIAALNRDLPFDRFVTEQLAGDLLPDATLDQKIATGFHRNTMLNEEGGIDREQFRVDAVADRVATTGSVFLGLTLGCARCHDHKFDPISQKEFFQIFAFFDSSDEPTLELGTPDQIALGTAVRAQRIVLENELRDFERRWTKGLDESRKRAIPTAISTIMALSPEQRDDRQWRTYFDYLRPLDAAFRERIKTLEDVRKREPQYPTTLVMTESSAPRQTHLHVGGDFTRPGEPVKPGVFRVLHPLPTKPGRSTRLDFARWLVDPANPLLARVTVNRIWQRYFGRGLVETENDFGTQGARPSHPELLDYLAAEFIARGWSYKAMHRLIVTSATYRQASAHRDDLTKRDPGNRLLGRQNRLRLDAEIIRDAGLVASGLLDERLGGPPVFPPQPDGVFGFTQIPRVWNASTGGDRYRRGLYTHLWRSAPHPALAVFDAPDAQFTCTRRNRSTTPLQALTLLNDQSFVEIAQGLATRILGGHASDASRLRGLMRAAVGRSPLDAEVARLQQVLGEQRASFSADKPAALAFVSGSRRSSRIPVVEVAAWTAVCRVVLNLDEFITRE